MINLVSFQFCRDAYAWTTSQGSRLAGTAIDDTNRMQASVAKMLNCSLSEGERAFFVLLATLDANPSECKRWLQQERGKEKSSSMVSSARQRWNILWKGTVINCKLMQSIISTPIFRLSDMIMRKRVWDAVLPEKGLGCPSDQLKARCAGGRGDANNTAKIIIVVAPDAFFIWCYSDR